MCNLGGLFGGKTETQTQQNSQQSGATTNPLAGTILQYGQQNVLPQYSAGNIANTAASLQPNQYITGAAGNQMGATANLFPAFGAAGNLAMNGVSPASVSQWMSPYTQNVINAYNQQADINDGRTLAQAQGSNALTGGLTNSATRGNMDYLRANLAANRNAQAANLYNTGYNTAVGNAFQNAGVQNTAANTLGSLTGAQSGANSALGQLAQLYYGQNQTSAMLPYGLTSQGASTLTGMVPGVGNSYSGTSVGSSTGTTQQNPGLIPSLLGLGGLWGQGADYANKNGGILGALGTFFPKFSEGGSVMPRYKGADHERLAETFHALKGMMRGGSAFPDRFAEGGWVPTVEREPEGPGPMASLFKGMAGAMPTYGGATQQAASDPIATQQAALSKFMEAGRPPMARGFADGGSTIEPMSPLSQFSNSMLAASPLAGMAEFNAKLQNQRILEEQNKRQNEIAQAQLAQQKALALGKINGIPTLAAEEFAERKYQADRPTWGVIGHDNLTGQAIYGWINPQQAPNFAPRNGAAAPPRTVTVEPLPPSGVPPFAAPGASPTPAPPRAGEATPGAYPPGVVPSSTPKPTSFGDPSLSGDEFLATLDRPVAEQVKAIVEGRLPPPGGFALKAPYWQTMLRLAGQYEPGFDMTNWSARQKTRTDFSAGKSSQNITAFNTAIGHLDSLDKAVDGLENSNYPMFNKVAQYAKVQGGDAKYAAKLKAFETAKTAVVDELTRAFRGSGGNVHDIVTWEKNISSADSPEALKGAIRSGIELLRSRIEALGDTYNRGMNYPSGHPAYKDPMALLNEKSRKAVERLEGVHRPEVKTEKRSDLSPPPAFDLPPGTVKKEFVNKATGEKVLHYLIGGRWVPANE